MSTVTMHKFYRQLKTGKQFRICDDKQCDFAENVTYRWKKVKCKRCRAKKGSRL